MSKSSHIPDDLWELPRSASEARAAGSKYYFTGKPCGPKGHVSPRATGNQTCQACTNELSRRKYAERREQDRPAREAEKAAREALRNDPEYQQAQKEKARQAARDRKRQRIREEGTEEYYEAQAAYVRAQYWSNPEKQRQRGRDRRASGDAGWRSHRLRTPPWLSDDDLAEINHIYEQRPVGYHVDHIAPIKHPEIAGLHVPHNLQILKGRHNEQKLGSLEHEPAWYVEQGMAVWREDVSAEGFVDWNRYWPDSSEDDTS